MTLLYKIHSSCWKSPSIVFLGTCTMRVTLHWSHQETTPWVPESMDEPPVTWQPASYPLPFSQPCCYQFCTDCYHLALISQQWTCHNLRTMLLWFKMNRNSQWCQVIIDHQGGSSFSGTNHKTQWFKMWQDALCCISFEWTVIVTQNSWTCDSVWWRLHHSSIQTLKTYIGGPV